MDTSTQFALFKRPIAAAVDAYEFCCDSLGILLPFLTNFSIPINVVVLVVLNDFIGAEINRKASQLTA